MPSAPTYDFFLVLPTASHLIDRMSSVGADATSRLLGVDLFYRPDTDVALVALRIDARSATHSLLDKLRKDAGLAGASALEPARLPAEDRERFYREHLQLYPLRVNSFPTVADAARKLAVDLGVASKVSAAGDNANVRIRYRRGDRWQLARPRSLTREGVWLYAVTPPREGDQVMVLLESGGVTVPVRAQVVHVTPEDVADTVGGPGFAARFMVDRAEERLALERMVAAGRADGLGTLRPAPPRREPRYIVRWPVSMAQSSPVPALDVSFGGMFVATDAVVSNDSVEVRVASDDQGPAMRAKARVARRLTRDLADARGVAPGYGLEMCGFAPGDDDRFHGFVNRIGRRALHRLMVGASEARLRVVAAPLAAAGYVVTGVTTNAELLAGVNAAPPDLVVLDHDFSSGGLPRSVLCYSLENGHSGKEVRALADAALLG